MRARRVLPVRPRRSLGIASGVVAALALLLTLVLGSSAAGAATSYPVVYNLTAARPGSAVTGANDFSCKPSAAHPNPVVLVHGLVATAGTNWGTMSPLLANNGYCVFALTYGLQPGNDYVGGLKPMEQSAQELKTFVNKVLAATGAKKVDLVGHSEGTVMPQWYLKFLGGAAKVDKYVAFTPIYKGTTLDGLAPFIQTAEQDFPQIAGPISQGVATQCGSCEEFFPGSAFNKKLYADGVYAVPGVTYTTVMTKYDELVTPYTSGRLDAPNATNYVLQDGCPLDLSEHAAVGWDPRAAQIMLNALDPAHAKPLPCVPTLPVFGAPLG